MQESSEIDKSWLKRNLSILSGYSKTERYYGSNKDKPLKLGSLHSKKFSHKKQLRNCAKFCKSAHYFPRNGKYWKIKKFCLQSYSFPIIEPTWRSWNESYFLRQRDTVCMSQRVGFGVILCVGQFIFQYYILYARGQKLFWLVGQIVSLGKLSGPDICGDIGQCNTMSHRT